MGKIIVAGLIIILASLRRLGSIRVVGQKDGLG